ncbi:uncharacterized protein BP5553_06254 [Venustampulla echinocandica]|uniref:BTB domain-containing protein n=1 Tax=Venustampulla echinocandica TaxID=2656787 RepID=A0A370TMZ7_9HELO|nr:uncharacterized protein BP5553_06254 [Venustampulla echinocandica]RDL36902.1 hypothetical protein BP5553_06254 [Venustampulla echinocandica]
MTFDLTTRKELIVGPLRFDTNIHDLSPCCLKSEQLVSPSAYTAYQVQSLALEHARSDMPPGGKNASPVAFGTPTKIQNMMTSVPLKNAETKVKAAAKSHSRLFNHSNSLEFVTILVDEGGQPPYKPQKFVIHKAFACHHSPVFRSAFNSNCIEGETQEYRLTNTTVGTVELLFQWLYSQDLNLTQLEEQKAEIPESGSLVLLWLLADKLLIRRLQNLVIRQIDETIQQFGLLPLHVLHTVWQNTAEGCALRRYLIDAINCRMAHVDFKASAESFPKDMLVELVVAFKKRLPNGATSNWTGNNLSSYYVPED